ncbi:hypothetical protein J4526_00225 [Desulfurococcaceae archaeon MEX13E-LK6-19]|nr:hypothetical protein J4526_00225 [Desulfurococcaceae archaeon MEX13E-LK6-19]
MKQRMVLVGKKGRSNVVEYNVEKGSIDLDIVIKEDDGLAWVDGNKIIINARWLTNHPPDLDEIIEEINRSTIHEIIEHYYGLGHRAAVIAESLVFGSPWYTGNTKWLNYSLKD